MHSVYTVLAANPALATGGQIAAIIILLYASIIVILLVALNLLLAVAMGWVREKSNLIKVLRPTVDSVNKTTEAAMSGQPISENENTVVRTIAQGPAAVKTIDKQVNKASNKVTNAVIEFRARTVQAQFIVKALFVPSTRRQLPELSAPVAGENLQQIESPGYRALPERKTDVPAASESASQLNDVQSR